MKPVGKINQDVKPEDLKDGDYFYAKGIVSSEQLGSSLNENGTINAYDNTTTQEDYLIDTINDVGIIDNPDKRTDSTRNNYCKIIGKIPIDNDRTILFIWYKGLTGINYSIITVHNSDKISRNGNALWFDIGEPTATYGYIVRKDNDPLGGFNFNPNYKITGAFQYNYLNQLIIAFTDNYNTPYYINLDTYDSAKNVDFYYLYPKNTSLNFTYELINGSINTGTYFAFFSYSGNDGTQSNWGHASLPIYLTSQFTGDNSTYHGEKGGINSSKGIKLSINVNLLNLDYNYLEVAFIHYQNGVVRAFKIPRIELVNIIGTQFDIFYVDDSRIEEISVDEILVDPEKYDKIKYLTNLKNDLFGINVSKNLLDYNALQLSANKIKVYFSLSGISNVDDYRISDGNFLDSTIKSIKVPANGEIYALYIAYERKDGTFTKALHIPGRLKGVGIPRLYPPLEDGTLTNATIAGFSGGGLNEDFIISNSGTDNNTQLSSITHDCLAQDYNIQNNVKYFRIRDILLEDPATNVATPMCYWENQNETYPSNFPNGAISYNPSVVNPINRLTENSGFVNAGTPVRHHKIPYLRSILDNRAVSFSSLNDAYRTIQIRFDNIERPSNDYIGFRLYAAKRDINNSHIISQGEVYPLSRRFASGSIDSNEQYFDNGANIDNVDVASGVSESFSANVINTSPSQFFDIKPLAFSSLITDKLNVSLGIKLYFSYDYMLYIKYVSGLPIPAPEFPIESPSLVNRAVYFADIQNDSYFRVRDIFTFGIDASGGGSPPYTNYINFNMSLDAFGYVAKGNTSTVGGKVINFTFSDGTLVLISNKVQNYPFRYSYLKGGVLVRGTDSPEFLLRDTPDQAILKDYRYYQSFLATLKRYIEDAYVKFYNQEIYPISNNIRFSSFVPNIINNTVTYSYDTFWSTFKSLKRNLEAVTIVLRPYNISTGDSPRTGMRRSVFRVIQSPINCQMTYENPTLGTLYTDGTRGGLGLIYPISSGSKVSNNSILEIVNQYDINPDFQNLGSDLTKTVPYNFNNVELNLFPYRIIQSNTLSNNNLYNGWRRFLGNKFYEMPKNKGKGVKLTALGNDRLIIDMEFSMFITRTIGRINTEITDVILGTGELFSFPPEEITTNELGYAGLQQDLASILTPLGYFKIDSQQGKVFLFTVGEGLKDVTEGMRIFFRDNLLFDYDYSGTLFSNPGVTNLLAFRGWYIPYSGNTNTQWTYDFKNDNPYIGGKGISLAYDREYERIIISVKNFTGTQDKSCTVSFSPRKQGIVSFHPYFPNCIWNTRNKVLAFEKNVFVHNKGLKGRFYNNPVSPSFIDVCFPNTESYILHSISWKTESKIKESLSTYLQNQDNYYKTLTHITVRNNYQCSERIALNAQTEAYSNGDITNDSNSFHALGKWNFNKFFDAVISINTNFLLNLFQDFTPNNSNVNASLFDWFERRQFNNRWHIVRFEYDNVEDYDIYLNDVEVNATPISR